MINFTLFVLITISIFIFLYGITHAARSFGKEMKMKLRVAYMVRRKRLRKKLAAQTKEK